MDRPIFFCHIPKTAGTTVRLSLEKAFAPHEIIPDDRMMARNGGQYPRPQACLDAVRGSVVPVRLLRGHYHLSMGLCLENPVTITVLREPVARTVSHIKHALRAGQVSEQQLRSSLRNGTLSDHILDDLMTRMLGGNDLDPNQPGFDERHAIHVHQAISDPAALLRSALEALNHIDVLGFTERMTDLQCQLGEIGVELDTNIVNSSPNLLEFSDDEITAIEEHNILDTELYRHAWKTQLAYEPA